MGRRWDYKRLAGLMFVRTHKLYKHICGKQVPRLWQIVSYNYLQALSLDPSQGSEVDERACWFTKHFLLFSFFSNTVLLKWYLCKLVTFSAQFTIFITYKVFHDFAPFYSKDLLQRYQPVRSLSSSQNNLGLTIQNFNVQFYGRRVFSGAAPHLWNHLPEDIKNADSIRKQRRYFLTELFKLDLWHFLPFHDIFLKQI